MKREHLSLLRCPATWSELELRDPVWRGDILMSGMLEARTGGRRYLVEGGAAYLGVLDETWGTILKELINRREIIEDDLLRPAAIDDSPAPPPQPNEMADIMFREACEQLPKDRPLRLLDCGAGMFETSAWFAERGIDVVSTETEISMVRYANFEGEAHGDPIPFEINGRPYHIRDPKGHAHYFSRVVCDIQRLPFAAGSFDVAFCRAMLHHVDSQARAIREMARLVKPGGLVLICAEPARSILDGGVDYHENAADREEGMNEQTPTLLAYRRPLSRACRDVAIQYWPSDPARPTQRFFRALRYNYAKHLWPGETLRDWKWVKLLPWFAGVNLYGTRKDRVIKESPSRVRQTLNDVARIYTRYDKQLSIEALRQGTGELKKIRRGLLAIRPDKFPARVNPGKVEGLVLESGWGPVEKIARVRCRRVGARASVVLGNSDRKARLEIVYTGGSEDRSTLLVNGARQKDLEVRDGIWQRRVLNLAKLGQNGLPRIVQLELRALEGNGPAVRSIRLF